MIMHLEERALTDVTADSDLLIACYSIVEKAVSYLVNDRLTMLEAKQREQARI